MNRIIELVLEAHRRSLWQVLGVYAVASWIAYEVILSLTEGLGLPAWVPPFALVLFIIGLPMVLATAFVQEGLPELPGGRGAGGGEKAGAAGAEDTAAEAAGARPVAAPPAEAAAAAHRPVLTWGRSLSAGVAAFLALTVITGAYMGMRNLGVGPAGTLLARGELEARQPIVVADFEGITGDAMLATVVAEALRADLAQSDVVTVADRSLVAEGLRRMTLPEDAPLPPAVAREVAVRLGLGAVVEGEVARAGGGYTLTARVVSADSARTLAAFRESAADSTAILDAIERLSHALRSRVGESLGTVRRSAPLEAAITPSLPALRLWAEASALEGRSGNRARAIQLLEEAVALDSAFATAWRLLATIHYNDERRAATLDAIDRTLAHPERLSDRVLRSSRAFRASVVGDLTAARRERLALQDVTGDSALGLVNLSDVAWNQGDFQAAEAYAQRALEHGDTSWVGIWNLWVAQADGGRSAAARATAEAGRRALPDVPAMENLLWAQAMMEGRYDDADSLAVGESWRTAQVSLLRGQLSAAAELWAEVEGLAPATSRFSDAGSRVLLADDPAAADLLASGLEGFIESGAQERWVLEVAVILALGRQAEAARAAVAHYEERVPEPVRWKDAFLLHLTAGFLALDEGREAAAFEAFGRARQSTVFTAPVDGLLGRAYDMMERPDSAMAAYTRYLETPWGYRGWDVLGDPHLLVPTHERLAYLHEQAGNAAAAARHASRVVELWAAADPEFQGRVEAMRRLLVRVGGEGRSGGG
ncbi:MAG: hypothetical protein WEB88_05045 [Gemmatimonadota bacterium]